MKINSQKKIQLLTCYLRITNIIGEKHNFKEENTYGHQLNLSKKNTEIMLNISTYFLQIQIVGASILTF